MQRSGWLAAGAAAVAAVLIVTNARTNERRVTAPSTQKRPGTTSKSPQKPRSTTNKKKPAPNKPAAKPTRAPTKPKWAAPANCVSGTVSLNSLTVPAGQTFCLDPDVDTTITLAGNLIVYGRLQARPAHAGVQHVIRWTGVREAGFVGGGQNEPLDTDPGLWVQGAGVLDLAGTPRVAWNRTGSHASWRASDELVVTPTRAGDYTSFKRFKAGSRVPYSVGPGGRKQYAEVLNLTRNVRLEGTPSGRAHIHIVSTSAQSIRGVAIRWMGPRKQLDGDKFSDPIPGRQSLHLHRNNDGSRGTVIDSVVVRDSGGMGIDIHNSHGVTVRGAITYNTNESGIGWTAQERSDDTLIEDTVAARQVPIPNFQGYQLTGIALPPGVGNTLRRSVAVGNLGNATGSGVLWPETTGGVHLPGVWTAEDVVSHNNKANGVFTWQNSGGDHVVNRFVCYANGKAGVEHGAYLNPYVYRDLVTWGSGVAGVIEHAGSNESRRGQTQQFVGGHVDGMHIAKHTLDPDTRVVIRGVDLTRPGGMKLVVDEKANGGGIRGWYEFFDTPIEPSDIKVVSIVRGTVIRIRRPDGSWYQVRDT